MTTLKPAKKTVAVRRRRERGAEPYAGSIDPDFQRLVGGARKAGPIYMMDVAPYDRREF
ncbi:MAG TPA: hypothetical protein VHT02_03655 [Methylocella sp.]|nr:hypothetical protein [Methylocella sp.]